MKFLQPVTSNISKDIPNYKLTLKSIQVMEAMRQINQYGFGHVLTGLRHSVENKDPEYRKLIQNNVDELTQGFAVLYVFSVWDASFEREETAELLKNHMSPHDARKFRAFRHVRHSVAHFYSGKRATQNELDYQAFDDQMQGTNSFPNLLWDADNIDLTKAQVGGDAWTFITDLSTRLADKLANSR